MTFTPKRIVALVLLVVIGAGVSVGYLNYLYGPEGNRSRSADYSTEERIEANKEMAQLVLDETDTWDDEKVFCVVDSAYRGLFENETDYTVAIYVLDAEAFAEGTAADSKYTEETLWGYSKSGPKKDKYGSLIKVGEATVVKNEKSGEIVSFAAKEVE